MKSPKESGKKKSRKGEKHEKPLSLYGMSLDEAVGRLVAAKRTAHSADCDADRGDRNDL